MVYTHIIDIIVDTELQIDEAFKTAIDFLLIWVGLNIINILSRGIYRILVAKFEHRTVREIANECLEYLFHNSYRFFSENYTGTLNSAVESLKEGYYTVLEEILLVIIDAIIYIPSVLIIVSLQSVWIGLIFLLFIIIYTFLQIKLSKRTEKYSVEKSKMQNAFFGQLSDIFTNQFNIITFASTRREITNLLKLYEKVNKSKLTQVIKEDRVRILSSLFYLVFFASVMLLGIYYYKEGALSLGIILLIQLYAWDLQEMIEWFTETFQVMNDSLWEATPMIEILNTPHEIVDKTEKKLKVWAWKIEFQDITFGYSKDVKVFEHFDLRIKPGERIALVGQSGSGKSSITKLLFRFFDLFEGKITIDDQDISQVTQESLRSQISLVPQDVILFHRSLKENICYGNPKATEEEMISACKMARCYDFISKLEQGFDTLVGERGIKLSWGERQRVAIARAILENKKILVLDEATSALDSESEVLIQEAMEEVMKNKTCIVIAHRLSTIRKMDKIVVMEKGKIIEKWSHNELLLINGTYAKLWNLQSDGFIGDEQKL